MERIERNKKPRGEQTRRAQALKKAATRHKGVQVKDNKRKQTQQKRERAKARSLNEQEKIEAAAAHMKHLLIAYRLTNFNGGIDNE